MIPSLPRDEIKVLNDLSVFFPLDFRYRLALLHEAGWSLRSLADALDVGRSTVYYWITHSAPVDILDILDPTLPYAPQKSRRPKIVSPVDYPVRALAPDVHPAHQEEIRRLAPIARRYRAGSAPDSSFARARRQLDFLVHQHHRRGVPTARLAELGGVTYRAMATRIKESLYR